MKRAYHWRIELLEARDGRSVIETESKLKKMRMKKKVEETAKKEEETTKDAERNVELQAPLTLVKSSRKKWPQKRRYGKKLKKKKKKKKKKNAFVRAIAEIFACTREPFRLDEETLTIRCEIRRKLCCVSRRLCSKKYPYRTYLSTCIRACTSTARIEARCGMRRVSSMRRRCRGRNAFVDAVAEISARACKPFRMKRKDDPSVNERRKVVSKNLPLSRCQNRPTTPPPEVCETNDIGGTGFIRYSSLALR